MSVAVLICEQCGADFYLHEAGSDGGCIVCPECGGVDTAVEADRC